MFVVWRVISPCHSIVFIMKCSNYNIIQEKGDFSYWYNCLTRHYFRLPLSLGRKVYECLQKQMYNHLPIILKEKLTEGGFIIPDDFDELRFIRRKNDEAIESKNYFLIILPTLNCNYRCWYCIQEHVVSKMDNDTLEKIKSHIDYMIDQEHISSLHIDWFGGEPLMYFKEIVVPISEHAKEKCRHAGIDFLNSSTTNGFFLNPTNIRDCLRLGFKQFQITLDGNREHHDTVKFINGCDSTFNHVLTNINNLLNQSSDVIMYLRINYTKDNLTEEIVDQVKQYIDPINRSKIVVTPRKVLQENVDRNFNAHIIKILDKFREAGFLVEYCNFISSYLPCYANKKYYNAINFNGNVVKCTACNDLYESNARGVLLNDGKIAWNNEFDKKYLQKSFENDKCLSCNKLPLCMGLCPREHFNGETYCKEKAISSSFENSIITLIDRSYEIEALK